MAQHWNDWAERRDSIALHGLTPAFADAIARRVGPDRAATGAEAAVQGMASGAGRAALLQQVGDAQEIEQLLNVRPDPIDIRDRYYEAPLLALPVRRGPIDLEAFGLAVRDQGAEGSCTGQGLAAVIDLQNAQRRATISDSRDRALSIPTQVSARMLYENARAYDEYPDDGLPGSSARGVIKGFFHNGVCDAALAPYFVGEVDWTMTAEIGKAARATALGSYFRLRHILNDYHAALMEVEAVLCSAIVHEGWTREAVQAAGGRIRLEPDPQKRRLQGAHAFAIVGYDSNGFYVLNSWGTEWGGCAARRRDHESGQEDDVPQPGIAHWSYEDWQSHVLDAWVLRLAAPFPNAFGMTGGYVRPQARAHVPPGVETRETAPPPSTSGQQIRGHYVHLDDGAFVPREPYPSSLASIRETGQYLRARDEAPDAERYDDVVLYAHGGLNGLKEAAARTAAMTPGFKRNGVYPIFFLWRTGLAETLGDLARSIGRRIFERTAGVQDLTDTLIENAARRIGRPIWSDMKEDARRSFAAAPGDGRRAMQALLEQLAGRTRHPVRLHFIGHSAGAILLGRLFEELGRPGAGAAPLAGGGLGTISLMAPACTLDFFEAHLARLPHEAGAGTCVNYLLPDALERQDGFAGYGRSLLYLISNGLEGGRRVPLAGMERFWGAGRPGWTTVVSAPGSPDSRAATHGGFDNDAVTMNSILSRICGRPLDERNGGFTAADLVWD
jgi:hypothetical protein